MPYDKPHLRITFGGHLAGSEIWECGLNFAPSTGTTIGWPESGWDLVPIFNALKTAFNASNISAGASFESCKIALLDTSGNYTREPQEYVGTTVTGSILTLASSPQDSVCITLWSGSKFGKANYGRFYLPWSGVNVDRATGKIVASLMGPMLTAWKTAIETIAANLLNQTETPYLALMNMSTVGPSKKVYYLKMGDVLDTQRRRRNRLREVYLQTTVVT